MSRAIRGLFVAGVTLFVGFADTAEAGGSQKPALRRLAKSIGRMLERSNKTDVRLVLGPDVSGEVAEFILGELKTALEAEESIETISDDAQFTAQIEYVRSDLKVCLEIVIKNSRDQSLGKFSANFDLELPEEPAEVVAK